MSISGVVASGSEALGERGKPEQRDLSGSLTQMSYHHLGLDAEGQTSAPFKRHVQNSLHKCKVSSFRIAFH